MFHRVCSNHSEIPRRVFSEVEKFAQLYTFNMTDQNIFLNHAKSIGLQVNHILYLLTHTVLSLSFKAPFK